MLLQIGERTDPAEALRAPGRIGGILWPATDFEVPRSILTGEPMGTRGWRSFTSEPSPEKLSQLPTPVYLLPLPRVT
ncbi:MAG: hypothetical protein DI640_14080 [Sphingomonas taxi]|uniref:Uncharacterized protein n=1 Tax=Sphingomonas taxi TaxID=1549858 RepID=A0A2W4YRL5_9SPHN|nr:MAG: hypothetical protein DI640_14080 [Sphingomonas taxi]